MTEQFVGLAHRRVTLCVARSGQGQPLLVLGGTGSDLRNRPNPLQWPIASEFDVLAYDHRGLGRSVADDPDYQPTMADFAADGLALCDQQGLDEFDGESDTPWPVVHGAPVAAAERRAVGVERP